MAINKILLILQISGGSVISKLIHSLSINPLQIKIEEVSYEKFAFFLISVVLCLAYFSATAFAFGPPVEKCKGKQFMFQHCTMILVLMMAVWTDFPSNRYHKANYPQH